MEHNNLVTEVATTKKDIEFIKNILVRLEESVDNHKLESKERSEKEKTELKQYIDSALDGIWNKIVTVAVVGGIIISGFWAFELWMHPSEAQYKESVEKQFNSLNQRVTTIEVTDNIKSKNKEE